MSDLSKEEMILALDKVDDRLKEHRFQKDQEREAWWNLCDSIEQAKKYGVSNTVIANLLGVSRERIRQMILEYNASSVETMEHMLDKAEKRLRLYRREFGDLPDEPH